MLLQPRLAWRGITLRTLAGDIAIPYARWWREHLGRRLLRRLDDVPVEITRDAQRRSAARLELSNAAPTAVLCVPPFSSFGLHLLGAVCRMFPRCFTSFIFVGAEPAGTSGPGLKSMEWDLTRYVAWATTHHLRADYRAAKLEKACQELVLEHPQTVVFIGTPAFRDLEDFVRPYGRTADDIARGLLLADIPIIVIPVDLPDARRP